MTKAPMPRILVVDDEPSLGMIFHRILGDAGYEVVSASKGAECLRVLKKTDVQMVFLDLQMPGMDGVQTLKRIRESHSTLPVIIMTAFQTVSTAVETLKLGALDYLIKPLAADKLPSVVQQALNVTNMSSQVPANKIIALTKAECMEELVEANSMISESERAITNQTIRYVKTENTGYKLNFPDARVVLDVAN